MLADESMDISGTEQMPLGVQYLCEEGKSSEIREGFLGFCPLPHQDAKTIASSAAYRVGPSYQILKGPRLCLRHGASTMSGHVSGIQKIICDVHPRALYTHCRSVCELAKYM